MAIISITMIIRNKLFVEKWLNLCLINEIPYIIICFYKNQCLTPLCLIAQEDNVCTAL